MNIETSHGARTVCATPSCPPPPSLPAWEAVLGQCDGMRQQHITQMLVSSQKTIRTFRKQTDTQQSPPTLCNTQATFHCLSSEWSLDSVFRPKKRRSTGGWLLDNTTSTSAAWRKKLRCTVLCVHACVCVCVCSRACVSACVCDDIGYYRFYQVFPVGPVWPHWRPRVGSLLIMAGLRCRPGVHPCIAPRPVRYALRPEPGSLPQDHPGSGVVAPWLPPGQLRSISSASPSLPYCPVCCVCIGAFTAGGARGIEAASTAYSIWQFPQKGYP